MAGEGSPLRDAIRARLRATRNADGGWPYVAGKKSRLEPTCWALLALSPSGGSIEGLAVLNNWPRGDGRLIDAPGLPPNNAFNALAAILWLQHESTVHFAKPILSSLVTSKGLTSRQSKVLRQDNSLAAWPWVDGSASWVEPTAWCLLLFKQAQKRGGIEGARERIDVGDRLLLDRACTGGGWNYGNSQVHGHDLWPYVPTTALALLALQDRSDHQVVQRSVQQLQAHWPEERSALAVALSVLALRIHGIAVDPLIPVIGDITGAALDDSDRPGDLLGLAVALYALKTLSRPASALIV